MMTFANKSVIYLVPLPYTVVVTHHTEDIPSIAVIFSSLRPPPPQHCHSPASLTILQQWL